MFKIQYLSCKQKPVQTMFSGVQNTGSYTVPEFMELINENLIKFQSAGFKILDIKYITGSSQQGLTVTYDSAIIHYDDGK